MKVNVKSHQVFDQGVSITLVLTCILFLLEQNAKVFKSDVNILLCVVSYWLTV